MVFIETLYQKQKIDYVIMDAIIMLLFLNTWLEIFLLMKLLK